MLRAFGPIIIGMFLVAPAAWAETSKKTKAPAKAAKSAPKVAKKKPRRIPRSVIRRALKEPRGSLCLGSTSWGKVKKARKISLKGRDYAFFKHIKERKTHYGTKELGRLIRHVARKVARKHAGTKLQLGNAGLKAGGKIKWSVSHQCGRDIDIAMFTTNRRGRPVKLSNYAKFNRQGRAAGNRKFDVARNFTLLKALVMYNRYPVQWVFMYRPLKKAILAYGKEKKASDKVMDRLSKVLRMPSDSAPHRDHFHVRLFCSVEDRLHGCLDRGPFWDWVDRGDEKYAERVQLLLDISRMDKDEYRVQAIQKLYAIRAEAAATRFVEALVDKDKAVRKAARKGLKLFAKPEHLPGIKHALKQAQETDWAKSLFKLLKRVKDPKTHEVALGVLLTPGKFLSKKVAKGELDPFRIIAAKILAKHGRKPAAVPLRKLLHHPSGKVREAAHEALRRVTNQPIRGSFKTKSKRRLKRLIKRWDDFFGQHQKSPWLQWVKIGFQKRGIRFSGRMMQARNVPSLIKALKHRDEPAYRNALVVLKALTGHDSGTWRTKRKQIRHWKRWWRDNKKALLSQAKKTK